METHRWTVWGPWSIIWTTSCEPAPRIPRNTWKVRHASVLPCSVPWKRGTVQRPIRRISRRGNKPRTCRVVDASELQNSKNLSDPRPRMRVRSFGSLQRSGMSRAFGEFFLSPRDPSPRTRKAIFALPSVFKRGGSANREINARINDGDGWISVR